MCRKNPKPSPPPPPPAERLSGLAQKMFGSRDMLPPLSKHPGATPACSIQLTVNLHIAVYWTLHAKIKGSLKETPSYTFHTQYLLPWFKVLVITAVVISTQRQMASYIKFQTGYTKSMTLYKYTQQSCNKVWWQFSYSTTAAHHYAFLLGKQSPLAELQLTALFWKKNHINQLCRVLHNLLSPLAPLGKFIII